MSVTLGNPQRVPIIWTNTRTKVDEDPTGELWFMYELVGHQPPVWIQYDGVRADFLHLGPGHYEALIPALHRGRVIWRHEIRDPTTSAVLGAEEGSYEITSLVEPAVLP